MSPTPKQLYSDKKRRWLSFSLMVAGVFLFHMTTAAGLSEEQRRVLDSGAQYFDTEVAVPGVTCGSELVGSDNVEKVYYFLVNKGLSPIAAVGIMGNLQAESGFNPKRVQGTETPSGDRDNITVDGSTGYGLAQWTDAGRQQALADFAAKAGKPSGDLGVQLDFLYFESTEGNRAGAWDLQKQQTDVRAATYAWEDNYENPAAAHQENRVQFAQDLLTRFGSSAGALSGSIICASGQVTGGFSLPVDRKFYDENKFWFIKTHHSNRVAVDIPVDIGTEVRSITAGKVIQAPNGTPTEGYGLGVTIDAGNGVIINYGHGSDGGSVSGAKEGDTVQPSQVIMHSATTGSSTGPHLHVDIFINNVRHCPQYLFVGIAEGKVPPLTSLPTSGCTHSPGQSERASDGLAIVPRDLLPSALASRPTNSRSKP